MVTETGLTTLRGAAGLLAFGGASLLGPACAVHTEAPAASTVTPSAAPTSLPYQLRPPLCRAMSRPTLSRCPTGPDRDATTCQDDARRPEDASVTDHGQFRGSSGTTGPAGGGGSAPTSASGRPNLAW
ncbi:hypothetical protein GCM10010230_53740 [Streptomyces narbonensis]|nr:hypothetical protein GCM10010230_53740 [Streptomyces narbonensis]